MLAATTGEEGRPKRLLTFTTSSAGNQYFEMASAEGVLVVDASYPFEDQLVSAYAKLPDVPPIDLIYVDRQGGGLFKDLQSGDQAVRRLADMMGQVISPGGTGKLKVEARRFQPSVLPAVLLNTERGKAEQQARQLLSDPSQPSSLREMAEELLRTARAANAMRMTINAACPFIQNLAQQDPREPTVRHLMIGVYNSAILYNAEMLTPRNAKIFHDQFGDFMESILTMISERADMQREREALQQEREAIRRASGIEEASASHRIIFLMTPFNESYAGLEQALRLVVEERWGCQLCLARDQMLSPELRANVEAHMQQANAFLAEVSLGNPNVMYEVGRARSLYPHRPMIFLSHPHKETGKVTLPADLAGLLRLDYTQGTEVTALAEHLEKELRKAKSITELLDDTGLDDFVSPTKLKLWSRPFAMPEQAFDLLGAKYATTQAWKEAKADDLQHVVAAFGLDGEDTASLLRKIRRGLGV